MASIEITAVHSLPPAGPALRAFALDTPVGAETSEADGFVLAGWVLGQSEPAQTIAVSASGRTLTTLRVDGRRPDVAAAYPEAPGAEASGFQGWVSTVGLDPDFSLEVSAVTRSDHSTVIGTISGNRQVGTPPQTERPAPAQQLPRFFIIGAQRAGTRSLYAELSRHPDVQPARTEEVHFFSLFFDRGLRWFLSQFPPLAAGQMTGEASPYYLFHPLAPRRMHAVVPEAKLIVLLRDPVDRAYSHYQLEVRQGYEPLPFEAAIAAEEERLAGEVARILDDDTYVSFTHQHYSYLARGRYAEQLERWLARFPRQQLLVLRSETMAEDPGATYRRVTDFLSLAPHPAAAAGPVNEASYPPMAPETRRRLETYFAAPNAALGDLVGPDLTWNDR